jgi:phosphate:Na+ symporter
VINTAILVGFVPLLVRLTERLIPVSGEEVFKLAHLETQLVLTAELQVIEAKKKMMTSAQLVSKMSGLLREMIKDPQTPTWKDNLQKLQKYESITDRIEIEIAEFLTRLSEGNISDKASREIRSVFRINRELESMGDIYYKMATLLQRAKEESLSLSPEQIGHLMNILDLTDEAQVIMEQNLMSENGQFNYEKAIEKERQVDAMRNEIRREHLKHIGDREYNIRMGMYYNDLFTACEEAGDCLFSISQAIAEERGTIET